MTPKTKLHYGGKKNRTQKMHSTASHYECCDATFHGIQAWYVDMFEKLGWMILAKHRGMTDKTETYKHGLRRLLMAVEKKMRDTKDFDRKQDLKIIHENTMILCEHAEKDL